MSTKKTVPIRTEAAQDFLLARKLIKNELDDIKETLREFEDKDFQEVADLSSTARVLANAIDATFSKLGGLQDEIWTKIRNIEDRLGRD